MQKALLAFVTISGVLISAYFVYVNRPGPCHSIFEQTAPQVKIKFGSILGNSEWVIGRERVQEVTRDFQGVALHLKTCCESQQNNLLTPERYVDCLNRAKDYAAKIVEFTNIVSEAQAAKDKGDAELVDQKAKDAKAAADASASIAQDLETLAKEIPPPAPASVDASKPWESAKAIITLKSGKSVVVDAKSLGWGCCADYLTLDYGQSVPFKNMQSFGVLDENGKIEIITLKGGPVSGHVDLGSSIQGTNELGSFSTGFKDIKRVDFTR